MKENQQSGAERPTEAEAGQAAAKKPYRKPAVLSVEMLEVVAATCGDGKEVFTGQDACGVTGPISS